MWTFNLLVIILGLLIGSFLNVVIYRLPRGESIVWPGSRCTNCGYDLKPRDLVPVFSYLFLRGRCRQCGERIALRYPLIEILTAVLFFLIYMQSNNLFIQGGVNENFFYTGVGLQWSWLAQILSGWLLSFVLIACALIDLDHGIIPNALTYPGLLLGLALSYFTVGITTAFLGALLFGGILLLAAVLSRGGMGGGDVKLAAVIGAFCGWQGALVAFVLSSLLGGLWAVMLLVSRRANRKTAIRFGPFLAIGGWLAYCYGPRILEIYLSWL